VTLLYNLIMAVIDLMALRAVARKKSLRLWFALMALAAVAAVFLAGVLGENRFGIIRLAAYGVFLHGAVLMGVSTVVLWRIGRLLALGCAVAAAGILAVAYDAFLVEPTRLEVSRVRIFSQKISRPVKIVLLADLQTDRVGGYEREVFRRVIEEKPDLLLLAGDYLQTSWEERGDLHGQLRPLLQQAVEEGLADGGRIYAVQGNVDFADWDQMFEGLDAGRVTAVKSNRSFDLGQLQLTCLSWLASNDTSLKIAGANADRFHIVLGHSPNFALGPVDADLLLAGHTHGGQVQLPWIGPLITHTRVPRAWTTGLTELDNGAKAKLVVSPGIGMERGFAPRLRFLCPPELVVIELVPGAGQGGSRD